MPYFVLSFTAFLINIPLGYLRENCPKFSFKWFLWIHASIPLLIYLRLSIDASAAFIPFTIFCAVIGQIGGGYLRRKKMTAEDRDQLNQIGDLKDARGVVVDERDVTVALLNMGGPNKVSDIFEFQRRLFEDPLLIRFPLSSILQKFFAKMLIKARIKTVIERYEQIGGGSPIYQSTTAQAQALREELHKRGRNIDVTFSFNYSRPYPADTITKVKRAGKKYLLPVSLYPHYSKATTYSNIHYLKKEAQANYARLQFLKPPSYYLHPGYIQAFADRIHEAIGPFESLDDFYLVFSAHGLPLYFLTEGDPYPFEINQTVAQILAKLNRTHNWVLAYQSNVGPLQWLKPSMDDMIPVLARKGKKKILVVPVSFVGDHIETIHEINIEYRELAQELGITDWRMSKAIECHPGFIQALADSVENVLTQPQLFSQPIEETQSVHR